jgi:hypothetical protein
VAIEKEKGYHGQIFARLALTAMLMEDMNTAKFIGNEKYQLLCIVGES